MLQNPPCTCGSDKSRVLFDDVEDYRWNIAGTFSLVQCSVCGLVFTSPRPTKEEIGDLYPPNYPAHNEYDDDGVVPNIRKVALRAKLERDTSGFTFLPRIIGKATKNYSS